MRMFRSSLTICMVWNNAVQRRCRYIICVSLVISSAYCVKVIAPFAIWQIYIAFRPYGRFVFELIPYRVCYRIGRRASIERRAGFNRNTSKTFYGFADCYFRCTSTVCGSIRPFYIFDIRISWTRSRVMGTVILVKAIPCPINLLLAGIPAFECGKSIAVLLDNYHAMSSVTVSAV